MECFEVNDYRMYILVNEDIKISKGKLAGQVGHAVMSYLYRYIEAFDKSEVIDMFSEYMREQKKIILKCPQSKLEELEELGDYVVIRDKGYTQLEPNTLTCVNFGIITPSSLPNWVKELKLYN